MHPPYAMVGRQSADGWRRVSSGSCLFPGVERHRTDGHVLVIAKRLAQTEDAGGVLLAVDGQPDGTVSRRRFWRGNFLFDLDPALGSPGFKRFRPVIFS